MHEGIADYYAVHFLRTKTIGQIFAGKKYLRNSVGDKKYKVGDEAHSKGEVLLQALVFTESKMLENNNSIDFAKLLFKTLIDMKNEIFINYSFLFNKILTDASSSLSANDLDEIIAGLQARGINPLRIDQAPLTPDNIDDNSKFVTYKNTLGLEEAEGTNTYYAKISGNKPVNNFAWYKIQNKIEGNEEYSKPSLVLIDLETAQLIKAFDPIENVEITASNAKRYPQIISNASRIQSEIEAELNKMFVTKKSLKANETCTIGSMQVPCYSRSSKLRWVNIVLSITGSSFKLKEFQRKTIIDETLLLAPFTLIKQKLIFEMDTEASDSGKIVTGIDRELVDFGN